MLPTVDSANLNDFEVFNLTRRSPKRVSKMNFRFLASIKLYLFSNKMNRDALLSTEREIISKHIDVKTIQIRPLGEQHFVQILNVNFLKNYIISKQFIPKEVLQYFVVVRNCLCLGNFYSWSFDESKSLGYLREHTPNRKAG